MADAERAMEMLSSLMAETRVADLATTAEAAARFADGPESYCDHLRRLPDRTRRLAHARLGMAHSFALYLANSVLAGDLKVRFEDVSGQA